MKDQADAVVEMEDRLRENLGALVAADEELSSRCNKLHPTRVWLWREIRATQDLLEELTEMEYAELYGVKA